MNKDESGSGLFKYVVAAAVVALVVIIAFTNLGTEIVRKISELVSGIIGE